jgi:hypothetical protein
MHGNESTICIVDFLCKSNRIFGCIHFFDVAGASTGTPSELPNISSASIG